MSYFVDEYANLDMALDIAINAKAGDITGLTNVTLDAPDFAKKRSCSN